MTSGPNRLARVIGAAGCVALLAGCVFLDQADVTDQIELSSDQGRMLLVVCEQVGFTSLFVEYQAGQETEVVWQSENPEATLQAGETLSSADDERLGLDAPMIEPVLAPGSRLSVVLKNSDEVWFARFELPTDAIGESTWLRTDGTTSSQPCTKD